MTTPLTWDLCPGEGDVYNNPHRPLPHLPTPPQILVVQKTSKFMVMSLLLCLEKKKMWENWDGFGSGRSLSVQDMYKNVNARESC